MSTGPDENPTVVALSAGGVLLLLEVSQDRLPAIVHWGPAVDGLAAEEAAALVRAAVPGVGPNELDVPVRLALLPSQHAGWSGRPGLQGSRNGRDWSTDFRTTALTLDGVPVHGFRSSGAGVLEVTAADAQARLQLVLTVEMLASGLIRSRAELTNTDADAYTVDSLTLAYPVPAEAGELLDFAGRWGRERAPQRLPFRVGTHLRENRRGRTGADSAFILHAGTPGFGFADGAVYGVHSAFSGNHVHYADRVYNGPRVLGGGESLLPGEIRLEQGDSYRTPWLYGSFGVGLDQVARRFHAFLRARPRPVSVDRPVTLNVWEAVYMDHRLDRLLALADRAAEVGVERYVLDDGWFGARRHERAGLGDWVVSADAWPDGLHPLVNRVRELGMQFGLWFEPEMVNPDSDLARAHPDWIMSARKEWPVEARHQQVVNLAIPEAFAQIRDQISALVTEYRIDYIKWDHNRDLVEAGNQLDGGRPGVHAQTEAFYRLLDELRAAHPDLEIESCSSGGARIDLGVLERTDRVWVSDCIDPLERQHMMRWTAQLLPPEYLGSHIASGHSHTTGRAHSLSFRAGTAIFGHLGIEWDLSAATPAELSELAEWVAFFKEHRALLLGGDVVRMDGYDEHLWVHGVVSPDRSQALFAMATVGSLEATPGPRLRLRGLDPAASYRFRPVLLGPPPSGLDPAAWWGAPGEDGGVVLSGAALAHIGVIPPTLNPDQVILFHAERV